MAEFTRRTVLANPAPARRKTKSNSSSPRRRKFSAAQIAAGFGGKRRKAASRTHKPRNNAKARRANPTTKRRVVSANRTRTVVAPRRPARRKASRRNPGDIITLALANPTPAASKGKSTMARSRKRSASPRRRRAAAPRRRRRRVSANPVARVHRRRTRRRRSNPVAAAPRRRRRTSVRRSTRRRSTRRNPSIGGGAMSGLVTQAAWAIGGAVGSKLLTQAVLGSSNTGWMGYGGNIAAAFALSTATKMLLKNSAAGNAVLLGGMIQTLLRVLIDKTPFGAKVSNIGMGDYMAQNFLTPQRVVDGLHSAQLQPPVMPVAMSAAGVAGYGKLY